MRRRCSLGEHPWAWSLCKKSRLNPEAAEGSSVRKGGAKGALTAVDGDGVVVVDIGVRGQPVARVQPNHLRAPRDSKSGRDIRSRGDDEALGVMHTQKPGSTSTPLLKRWVQNLG